MTTILQIGDRIVDFKRHFDRLSSDAAIIGIQDVVRSEVLRQEILALSATTKAERRKVRVIFYLGSKGETNRVVTSEQIASASDHVPVIRLMTITDRGAPRGPQLKTGQLGSRAREIAKWNAAEFDEVLWLNSDQELTESTWANIFLIGRSGDLVEIATPSEASGLLPGIARSRIMDLLNASKIPVTVRIINAEEIPRFDEAFLTSSVQCLRPVTQIGRHKLHTMRPNAVFADIARLYRTWLTLDNDYDHFQGAKPVPLM